jgi:diaminopimelate epimerase
MSMSDVLRLTKHHGAGNDFLVLLDRGDRRPLSAAEVRVLCDRRRGVGADGVVRVVAGEGQRLRMELRNADGGVAEMSGNGIRCLVQAAVDAGFVAPGRVAVDTAVGERVVHYRALDNPGLGYASVAMGSATLGPERVVAEHPEMRWCQLVEMGNPHIVLFGPPVADDVVSSSGPRLERSVEGGANVEFVWEGPGAGELTLRVWERGVGETLACGTGACAAAVAVHAHGLIGPSVHVHNPGGPLHVEIGADGTVELSGPTQRLGAIEIDETVLSHLASVVVDGGDTGVPARPEVAVRP